jgi:uncharacterized membrane protein YeaQ/YmgE (transglycosylase-associated protein family)
MGIGTVLVWLVIGLIAGALATALTGGRGYGCAGNIVVGLLGAVVGGYLMRLLFAGDFSYTSTGFCTSVFVAAGGAVVLIVVLRLITGGGRRRTF